MSVYLFGKDGIGWNIDKDKVFFTKLFSEIGVTTTKNIFSTDHMFVFWWNVLFSRKNLWIRPFLFFKKCVVVITNDISQEKKKISKLIQRKNIKFICANPTQIALLQEYGCSKDRITLLPYFVDNKIFTNKHKSKKEIADQLGIPFEKMQNKILIGSFQRDSLGSNLEKPKWQKNPDGLIEIGKQIKDRAVFILAGPRRHYLVNGCKKNGIPYVFVGDESFHVEMSDDVMENNMNNEIISELYNLIDVYLVTSVSEGGPKAIPEAVLSEKVIFSTEVGFASMLLDEFSVCDIEEMPERILSVVDNSEEYKNVVSKNYHKTFKYYDRQYFLNNLKEVLQ